MKGPREKKEEGVERRRKGGRGKEGGRYKREGGCREEEGRKVVRHKEKGRPGGN